MKVEYWLSLGLDRAAREVFERGNLQTIEAAGTRIVGIPKGGDGHHLLGIVSSWEEAVVIATILRFYNPN